MKKLKSNRPSKFSHLIFRLQLFCFLFTLVSDDDDDDEEEEMDEEVVKDLQGFIAEPGEDVKYEVFKEYLFILVFLF